MTNCYKKIWLLNDSGMHQLPGRICKYLSIFLFWKSQEVHQLHSFRMSLTYMIRWLEHKNSFSGTDVNSTTEKDEYLRTKQISYNDSLEYIFIIYQCSCHVLQTNENNGLDFYFLYIIITDTKGDTSSSMCWFFSNYESNAQNLDLKFLLQVCLRMNDILLASSCLDSWQESQT